MAGEWIPVDGTGTPIPQTDSFGALAGKAVGSAAGSVQQAAGGLADLGADYVRGALGDSPALDSLNQFGARQTQAGRARMEANQPAEGDAWLTKRAFDAATGLPPLVAGLGIGALTKNPVAATAATMGLMGAGSRYAENRGKPGAADYAAAGGLMDAATAALPIHHLFSSVPGTLAGKLLRTPAEMAGMNAVAVAADAGLKAGTLNEKSSIGDVLAQMGNSAATGALTGLPFVPPAFHGRPDAAQPGREPTSPPGQPAPADVLEQPAYQRQGVQLGERLPQPATPGPANGPAFSEAFNIDPATLESMRRNIGIGEPEIPQPADSFGAHAQMQVYGEQQLGAPEYQPPQDPGVVPWSASEQFGAPAELPRPQFDSVPYIDPYNLDSIPRASSQPPSSPGFQLGPEDFYTPRVDFRASGPQALPAPGPEPRVVDSTATEQLALPAPAQKALPPPARPVDAGGVVYPNLTAADEARAARTVNGKPPIVKLDDNRYIVRGTPEQIRAAYPKLSGGRYDRTKGGRIVPAHVMDPFMKRTGMEAFDAPPPEQKPAPVSRLKPFEDGRLTSQAGEQLAAMAPEAGWAEIGGRLKYGDSKLPTTSRGMDERLGMEGAAGEVVGKTSWVPLAPWFPEVQRIAPLPDNTEGRATQQAVDKALAGQPMTEGEKRHISAMLDHLEAIRKSYEEQGANGIDPFELTGEMAQHADAGSSVEHAALVAKAVELDETAVERAAAAFENDDAGFMSAIRSIIDGQRNAEQANSGDGPGRSGERVQATDGSEASGEATASAAAEARGEPGRPDLELNAEPVPKPVAARPASRPGDLFGGKTDTQQAIHDKQIAQEAKRNGTAAVPAGIDGGLFSDRQKQIDIADAAHEAATSPHNDTPAPTDAQIEAGNYKKGHVRIQGLDISIENPAGSTRSGTDADGKPWSVDMAHHYGYIRGTKGADKEHVDVFVGPQPEQATAYVIDQIDPKTGKFDEHKVMLGFPDEASARQAYQQNYAADWNGLGAITPVPVAELKDRLNASPTKPLGKLPQAHAQPAKIAPHGSSSIIVKGASAEQIAKLKAIGGGLKNDTSGGWVFPKRREEAVRAALGEAQPRKSVSSEPDSGATITDVGEKIGGARKDQWRERGLNVADLDAMSDSEGATVATKANVWKPDFKAIANDSDPVTAAMVKVVYDKLAAQPRSDTPEGRRDYVKAMQAVRKVYGSVKSVQEARDAYQQLRAEIGMPVVRMGLSELSDSQKNSRRVLFSVYKGRSDPFVFDVNDAARARQLVNQGFPGAIEPWTRRYAIARVGGNGLTDRGEALYVQRARETGTPLTPEQIRAGAFEVRTKKGEAVGYAVSREDAEALAKTIYERTKGSADGKTEPSRPHLDKIERDNLPARIDREVTAQSLLDDFGFRGVEFGNWAAQDERRKVLAHAYDALGDLAEILNVPPRALSLNGTMGLAFGARGGGKSAAHYEPGKLVINMTKLRGAGSLAHEWAHALDHYLGELDRADAYKGKARGASGWYSQARYSGKPQERMERGTDGNWTPVQKYRMENLRPELAAQVDAVMKRLYETPIPREEALEIARKTAAQYGEMAAKMDDPRLKAMYSQNAKHAQQIVADLEAGAPSDRTRKSSFAEEAQKLSGKSSDGYWVRPTEMFARAFESYVFDRVKAMGAKSEYLVHGVEPDRYSEAAYKGNPYPVGEERTAINDEFAKLFDTLKTRTDDRGNIALFRRSEDTRATYEKRIDELHSSPTIERSKLSEVRMLDRGDVLDLTGYGDLPVYLHERHAVDDGKYNHPLTVEQWKKMPEWVDNPALVLERRSDGHLMMIAPEKSNEGKAIVIALEPKASAIPRSGLGNRHLQLTAFAKDSKELNLSAAIERGDYKPLYVDQRKGPEFYRGSGIRITGDAEKLRAQNRSLKTGRDLVKSRNQADMRRSVGTGDGIEINVAHSVADAAREMLPGLPDIKVVASEAQFPDAVRAEIERQNAGGARGSAKAVLHDGVIYLNASAAKGRGDLLSSIFHEGIGHFGLVKAFGGKLDSVLDRVVKERAADVAERAAAYGLDLENPADARTAAAEYLAKLAEEKPNLPIIRRLTAAIRELLRPLAKRLGIDMVLTHEDIVHQFLIPARKAVERSGSSAIGHRNAADQKAVGPSFSRDGGEKLDPNPEGRGEDDGVSFAHDVVQELAQHDDAFRYPTSKARTLKEVVGEVDPTMKFVGDTQRPNEKSESGADKRFLLRTGKGRDAYVYEGDGRVWLDVSHLTEGDGGSAIYAAVSDYARNTGQKFIGDPAGVSDVAVLRRTYNMLSSALRHGDADHLDAAPEQMRGVPEKGIPPLEWTGGSFDKIKSLMDTFTGALNNLYPGLSDVRYDFTRRQFVGADGRDAASRIASAGARPSDHSGDMGSAGGEARIGRQGLRAAILIRSLVQAERGARPGILEKALRQSSKLVSDDDKPLFRRADSGDDAGQRVARADTADTAEGGRSRPLLRRVAENEVETREPSGRLDGPWKDKAERAAKYLNSQLLDSFSSIKKAAPKTYALEQLFHGRTEERIKDLQAKTVEPIAKLIGGAKLTREDVSDYLYALHAPERNRAIAEKNPRFPDGGSGMTNAEAEAIVSRFLPAQRAALDQVAELVQQMNRKKLEMLRDSGLISADEFSVYSKAYKHYVPLKTDDSESPLGTGRGLDIRGKETREAFGRRSKADDPLAFAIQDASRAIIRAEKNRVGQAMVREALDNPNPELWEPVTEDTLPQVGYRDAAGIVQYRTDYGALFRDPAYFSAKFDGKEQYIHFVDPDIARQMKKLGQSGFSEGLAGDLMRGVSNVTRTLSNLYTQLNPDFALANFTRDIQHSLITATAQKVPDPAGMARSIAMKIPGSMKAAAKVAFGDLRGREAQGADADLYRQFKHDGGTTGGYGLEDIGTIQSKLQRTIDAASGDKIAIAKKLAGDVLAPIKSINEVFENATRFAAYKAALDQGLSREQAAVIAKNLTVNFNKRGEASPVFNGLWAFFNASVQANATVFRAAVNSRYAQAAVLGLMAAGIAQEVLGNNEKDAQGNPVIDYPSEFVRDRNLVVPFGAKHLKIPLAYGFNVAFTAGRRFARVAMGLEAPTKAVGDVLKAAFAAFSPLQGLVPTFAAPIWDVQGNERGTGGMIAKEPHNKWMPESHSHFASANKFFVALAEGLNDITGGDKLHKGVIDVSPEKMEYVVQQYLGGPMVAAMAVGNLVSPPEGGRSLNDVPILRRFVGEKRDSFDASQARKIFSEVDQRKKSLEAGDEPEAGERAMVEAVHQQKLAIDRINRQRNALLKANSKADTSALDAREKVFQQQAMARYNSFKQRGQPGVQETIQQFASPRGLDAIGKMSPPDRAALRNSLAGAASDQGMKHTAALLEAAQ